MTNGARKLSNGENWETAWAGSLVSTHAMFSNFRAPMITSSVRKLNSLRKGSEKEVCIEIYQDQQLLDKN